VTPIDEAALGRFRDLIEQKLGLSFDDSKLEGLRDVLGRRLAARSADAAAYLAELDDGEANGELRELGRELTVGETYFFRHREQFAAFSELALPERLQLGGPREVRVLSAGCASGEEPYSIAVRVLSHGIPAGRRVSIRAVDVNPGALEKASRARYSTWSLRETDAEERKRWFVSHGREYTLAPEVRRLVTFEERNLAHDDPALFVPEAYDIVFCRNVLMYFSPVRIADIVSRFARSLAPGGYLFLGHAETLRGVSHDFHLQHTHNAFYYRRKGVLEPHSISVAPPVLAPPPVKAAETSWVGTWLDTVQRTSERIERLTHRAPEGSPTSRGATALGARADLGLVLDLLRHERFAEALTALRELSTGAQPDPDATLLRAALLTHSGELDAAAAACRELLAHDELNAGAHYLLALSDERRGNLNQAVEHDRIAAYLDGTFAMPRLHLGLIARRTGDREGARRELGQAIALLQREEASRLSLFGGGFGREGLIALCRSALDQLGGTS
jgi:chemotaxis protein methyltransferase CheR